MPGQECQASRYRHRKHHGSPESIFRVQAHDDCLLHRKSEKINSVGKVAIAPKPADEWRTGSAEADDSVGHESKQRRVAHFCKQQAASQQGKRRQPGPGAFLPILTQNVKGRSGQEIGSHFPFLMNAVIQVRAALGKIPCQVNNNGRQPDGFLFQQSGQATDRQNKIAENFDGDGPYRSIDAQRIRIFCKSLRQYVNGNETEIQKILPGAAVRVVISGRQAGNNRPQYQGSQRNNNCQGRPYSQQAAQGEAQDIGI